MRFDQSSGALAIAAILPIALAQTSTDCNPTEKSCPADTGLDAYSFTSDFTQGSSAAASWTSAEGTTLTYGDSGAEFTINKEGQAPTISSDFYFLFGRAEVKMRAAPGTGIVSSVVLESDDLDEIDWEWLGGDGTQVETNFFGKGNTTTYDRATYETVSTPQDTFHTYTIDWTSERIEWIVDGVTVRTLSYSDSATVGGKNYPQTPMRVKLGNWCGGCSGEGAGTIEWAGGKTTFDDAPYIMYVETVSITNYNPANSYKWGDKTGDWESIEIVNGTSTASATGSATKTATASSSIINTSAPTSSISAAPVSAYTGAVVSKTITGSMHSTNSASVSAQNSNSTSMAGSVVSASTQVPGVTASGSNGSASSNTSNTSNTVTGPASQTALSGASGNAVQVAALFFSLAFTVLLL